VSTAMPRLRRKESSETTSGNVSMVSSASRTVRCQEGEPGL
jgi:hypothetical protein